MIHQFFSPYEQFHPSFWNFYRRIPYSFIVPIIFPRFPFVASFFIFSYFSPPRSSHPLSFLSLFRSSFSSCSTETPVWSHGEWLLSFRHSSLLSRLRPESVGRNCAPGEGGFLSIAGRFMSTTFFLFFFLFHRLPSIHYNYRYISERSQSPDDILIEHLINND